jgi:hypothetical protein
MNLLQSPVRLLIIGLSLLAISCQSATTKSDGATAITAAPSSSDTIIKRPGPVHRNPLGHQGKGSLSFKLDGQYYEADPAHVKAFSNSQIPMGMLMARNNNGLSVSMQINNMHGEGTYKMDGDKKGTLNFTINGKTYWTRSVTGKNYLDLVITSTTSIGTVILLNGTFEGLLEDKDGNVVHITEGKFTTESL